MDIEQVKKKKQETEDAIAVLIEVFTADTGIDVYDIIVGTIYKPEERYTVELSVPL